MPQSQTGRHRLPFLAVGQAQKEITHNEALARIDALLHPVVEDWLSVPPTPGDADIGKCWLISSAPSGDWVGKASQIACWIGGGWRFIGPVDAMRIRLKSDNTELFWSASQWRAAPAIADPLGGAVIDAEARAAIAALLSHFRMIGHFTA